MSILKSTGRKGTNEHAERIIRWAGKLIGLIFVLIILSFLVFALLYLAPGDPAEKRLTSQGVAVTREVLDAERERLGLFRPFLVRYGEWLFGIVRGDFGVSFKDDLPVAPKLLAGLRKTVLLTSASLLLSLIVSFPLAVLAAWKKDRISDHIVRLLCKEIVHCRLIGKVQFLVCSFNYICVAFGLKVAYDGASHQSPVTCYINLICLIHLSDTGFL